MLKKEIKVQDVFHRRSPWKGLFAARERVCLTTWTDGLHHRIVQYQSPTFFGEWRDIEERGFRADGTYVNYPGIHGHLYRDADGNLHAPTDEVLPPEMQESK